MVDESKDIMFSVEVTTYNQKEYIAQTLQSIIDQKHNYKYEILVSDDCSTDGTQDVIEEFHTKYPDIIKPLYNKKNLGAMKNYYQNISRAKGKYLMGCGGDDYWLPGKVEKQISFMERNLDFAVCYGKAECIDFFNEKKLQSLGENYLDFKTLLTEGNKCPALTLCIRRDCFIKYLDEIKPQEKDWLMEDYPFLIYAAFESLIYFLDITMAVYRVLAESISHQTDVQKKLKFDSSVHDIRKTFSQKYFVSIPHWDAESALNGYTSQNKIAPFKYLKRIIKCFIPYGIVLLVQKIKRKVTKGI